MNADLFWGEFLIRNNGIFTYAHDYVHPRTDVKVTLIGMDHGGIPSFFESVSRHLSLCDRVLFESSLSDQETPNELLESHLKEPLDSSLDDPFEKKMPHLYSGFNNGNTVSDRVLSSIQSIDLFSAYAFIIRTCFLYQNIFHKLSSEDDLLDHRQKGWEAVDLLLDKAYAEKLETYFNEALSKIPEESLKVTIDYVMERLRRIDSGDHQLKEIGETYIAIYEDLAVTNVFCSVWGYSRDEAMFNRFDSLIENKSNFHIGIKYGAAHMNNQRRLLEGRGFVQKKSDLLCVLEY